MSCLAWFMVPVQDGLINIKASIYNKEQYATIYTTKNNMQQYIPQGKATTNIQLKKTIDHTKLQITTS